MKVLAKSLRDHTSCHVSPMRSGWPLGESNTARGPAGITQWVKPAAGSKFKLDLLITENATDRNIPVAAALKSYS